MKNLMSMILLAVLLFSGCQKPVEKITAYAWASGPGVATDDELKTLFADWKEKGIDGLMYQGGHDASVYSRVGKITKNVGLEFHAWIPTMVQGRQSGLDSTLYAVNGNGESAWSKPAYVDYYTFLCPNREEVIDYLSNLYGSIADVPEVDGVHLDYIRFPDVILARGLWDKYGLVMDREYPDFDYCYCDTCVARFKDQTGIDIRNEDDPSQIEEWKQYRYDLITNVANRMAETAHSHGKKITAAVFPGPESVAKKIVRQEWNNWNLDAFYPMNYNDFYLEDTKWVGDMCKEGVAALNNSKPLYSGLFICPNPAKKSHEPDPENHGLNAEELGEAIQQSMANGAAGVCLFTPDRMTPEHWAVFEKAVWKK